ncbi:RagB/SusD family nutrient uptake outer membrane protein [Marinifilum sp. D714]|uniref:RagB/SusD family nutrient uptake outer membrane protein n=1 Tax=Marinifilum sp. D714 TaxID=2937523 RepID=UPI0027CE42F3|nr:RagB/SusD family nutrient uptake outer membrane protein [Marinifilum sp. D714]MDQ2178439.1 RagB/SusD family nutrient uptake outer membrane protein [Marinifilum sp. D714]
MKLLKKIYIAVLGVGLLSMVACDDITKELDDFDPLYSVPAETAIVDEASAELALTGVYATFRQANYGPEIHLFPDVLSGYGQNSFYNSTRPENMGWANNEPISVGASSQLGAYSKMYELVSRANWLLQNLNKLGEEDFDNPARKTEMEGEAYTLRAMGHFYLLRLFGQFYDSDSKYGVNLRTEPATNSEAFPRHTVSETYDLIIEDLDKGIAQAPELRAKWYVNKTFAKALKAKVYLYKGDYANASVVAKDVIDNSGADFDLAANYADQFQPHTSDALFQNPEIIFGSRGESNAGLGIGNFYSGFSIAISQKYVDAVADSLLIGTQKIAVDGGRTASVLNVNTSYGGYWTSKYTSYFSEGTYEMIYHMRMAEVYTILAEASARSANSVTTEALDALNTLRAQRGATNTGVDGFEIYPVSISFDEFLTAIRMEKLVELQAEGGESWFDLVRFDHADGFGTGFQVSDVKASATNSDKFILPIPFESIQAGGFIVEQNPSYE